MISPKSSLPKHHTRDVLFSASQIQERIDGLVEEMAGDCQAENFVLIGILRGSFMFLSDLVRDLYDHGIHPRIDFMTLESYGSGTNSQGVPRVTKDISVDVTDAKILLIDDILDTGRTLRFAREHMKLKGASEVKSCVMLDKPSRRSIEIKADYVGFTIEDHFVVGYGLDYDSYYRELPYITKVTFTEDS